MNLAKNATLSYLRTLAKRSLETHKPAIIGIAGSVGKSSTRNALEAILKDHFPTQSIGNSETGIPLGILGMKPESYSTLDWAKMLAKSPLQGNFLKGTTHLIAEMGIDDPYPPKNMEYLLTILKPTIAISLNATATHTMQFEKALSNRQSAIGEQEKLDMIVRKIAEEDTKIITKSGCKVGIYNADDKNLEEIIKQKTPTSTKLLSFGSKSTNDISYGVHTVTLDGTNFGLYVKTHNAKPTLITLSFPKLILPKEYREVFAASILAALELGLSLSQIQTSLETNYVSPKGRSSLLAGINNSDIIDSTYNASKVSIEAFLLLIDTLKKDTGRPILFLMGDMRELGEEAKIEHEAVAQMLLGVVDYLYLVGPLTREFILPIVQTQESSFKEIRWFDGPTRAGEYLKDNLVKNAIVLAKGSQNTIFLEEAVKMILKNKEDAKELCRQDEFWMKLKA
ncbi:MAG: hypothetical protein KBC15_00620 [Candidatus Levybacteria bacterium]|nr:hypothetical protein [Candidatus Levybacteria bacterium]